MQCFKLRAIAVMPLLLFLSHGAFAQNLDNKEEPASILKAQVIQEIKHQKRDVSITMQMVEDPGIPDPPAPAKRSQEILKTSHNRLLNQAKIAEYQETKIIYLSATIVDEKMTFLRWWHEKKEFRAWTNVDFNYFRNTNVFEVDGVNYLLFMGIGDLSSNSSHWNENYYKKPRKNIDKKRQFIITQGDSKNVEAVAPIKALHAYYKIHKREMKRDFREREKKNKRRLRHLEKNPPVPQDTVIKFWPRKGSRYLKKEGNK